MLKRFINRMEKGASVNNPFMGWDGKSRAGQRETPALAAVWAPPERQLMLRQKSLNINKTRKGTKQREVRIIFSEFELL